LVAASGTVIGGVGAAFWALLAGLVVRAVLTRPPGVGPAPTAARRSV
jgi:benzoate membrane transport protein